MSHCGKQLREEITRFINRFSYIDNDTDRTYLDASVLWAKYVGVVVTLNKLTDRELALLISEILVSCYSKRTSVDALTDP